MDKLFTKTPASNFAALALAGIMASGYMVYEAGKPVIMALAGGRAGGIKMVAMIKPAAQPVVKSTAKVESKPSNVASIQQQADKVASKVEQLAQTNQTKNDVVLGDETESVPVREEFSPAVNLLRNSSFEEDTNLTPRQWNYQYDSNSGNSFTTAEAIRTGTKGLKFVGGGTGNYGISQPATKLIERRDYAFSLWVKPVNTDVHTVKLSFWDEVNNKEAASKTFSFSGTKEWSRLVLQVSNKNNWNGKKWFPMVTVNGLGAGALYIDDAQLEEASSYTPYHFTGGGSTQSHVSILGDGSVEVDAHGNIYPAVSGVGGLGTGSNKFSELRLTKATIDNNGSLFLDGDIDVGGNGTFKGAMNFSGTIKSHLIPDADSTYDLGSTTKKWRVGYINQVYLQNAETINNNIDGDITFIENTTGGNNTLVFDLNAAADAVELRNDAEDLRLRAAGNGNLVLRAGDGATNSNVDGNDLFLAAEDAMTLRSASYTLQTSGATAGGSITVTALDSGIQLSTGSDSQGIINLKAAGTLTLDTTANRTNIAVLAGGPSSTSLTLRSLNGGIDLSSSSANGSGDIKLRSAGTLTLDTSANNTNILANTGQGRLVATSNNAGITAIQLLATNGGIDISTSGVGGLGELRLRAGGSLKLDTSGNNNNILVDSGTGDLLANVGTTTLVAQDDVIAAIALRSSRGGIQLSSSNANGNGDIRILSAGTLQLDTSATGSNIFLRSGNGSINAQSTLNSVQALALLATNGGIDLSTGNAGGNGTLVLRSGGSLKLDTSGNNNNILVDSGTGDLLANIGTGTVTAQDDTVNAISLSASRGGINLSSSSASGSGDIKLRSAGTLTLDTSSNNSNIIANTGQGRLVATSNNAGISAIQLLATNGGIDISTSGVGGLGELRLRSGGSLKLDTSGNNNNILVDSGTGDLLANIGTGTVSAVDDVVAAIGLSATRGGITLSSSSANGNGDIKILSGGTLRLSTSANNSNVLLQAGTGAFNVNAGASTHTYTGAYAMTDTAQISLTSNQAAINSIALLATNGGIDISTSGLGGLGELRLRAGGSLKLDTSGNNNNILIDSGTGDLLANIGTGTVSAVDDVIAALALRATRGGIELSTSNANGNGNLILKSGGTLQLSTSGTNSNVLLQAGTGAFNVNAGASTHTYTGAYAVTDTAQISLTSNQAAINSIALLSTNGGIDISTSGVGGLGELRLRSGGSLKIDTSGNNNNILVDSGTGDLLENVGTNTMTAQDDVIAAVGIRASRGGIQLSSSNANGNGDIRILSAGTLQLDTSATNSNILARTGTGRFDVTNTARSTQAIALLAGNGGIDLSTGNADGNGALVLRSGGSLKIDTSANNNNVLLTAGTGAFNVNAGASTHTYTGAYAMTDTAQISLTSNQAAINSIALLATNGGIDISTSGVGGLGELRLRAGGSLKLDTSGNNNNILVDSGTGDLLANVGTTTLTAQDDVIAAVGIRASRGGIQLSSSNANGNGDMRLLSAGTLQLDTSATSANIIANTGAGRFVLTAGGTGTGANSAIRLAATNGGIDLSTSGAAGNGDMIFRSAGTLRLDTSANNSNIVVRAGTGRIDLSGNTILINSGAGTLDLSSNSTIKIVSSTTASLWGETGTELGRAGQLTTVYGRMCIRGSDGGTACPAGSDGRLFVQVTGEATDDPGDVFDLAEYYPASEPVDPGTVVVADASSRATVKMSRYAYQKVLGVVSTTPAIRINEGSFEVGGSAIKGSSVKPLIALVGRVPVKVSNENGAIKVGDRLVASTKAGYAMKATKQGMTLGMALEDANFENSATEGKVMTFVNVSWYFPEVVEELEREYQAAQVLGTQPNPTAALTAATSAQTDTVSNLGSLSNLDNSITGVVAGAATVAAPTVTIAAPPTEFPNLIVTKALTVGKELKVSGKATFEGEVEVMADATFGKNVIIVGNLRIGGNLEVAGAVVTNLTAGASIAAGDPVAVGADGKAYRAGAGKAVVGVATLSVAAGEQVKVAIAGKVGNMTGLTTGARYFVSETGTLTTDGQGGQGLGVAVSATEMLVQPGIGLPAAVVPVKEPVKEEVKLVEPATPVIIPSVPPAGGPTVTPTPVVIPTVTPTLIPTEAPAPTVTPAL